MRKSFFFSLLAFFSLKAFAIGEFAFVKNLGQFHSNVEYFYQTNSSYVFFENSAITYQLYETPEHEQHHLTSKKQALKSFAFKTKFIGGNTNPQILESKKLKQHNNYFYGKDPKRWASNVPLFQEIQYSEVYQGIDLRVSTENGILKYDWIVNKAADPSQIQLEYDGFKKLHLENEELHIETPLGEIIEMKPFAYQVVNGEKIEVKCQYKIKKNQVRFEILEDYDKNLELIIDPTVIFATYTGSTADNFGFTATYDNEGNMYAGGTVYQHRLGQFPGSGTGFYPTTTGVVQTSFAGGNVDIGITKYSPDGSSVLYSTYLGGSGDDLPSSIIADKNSNLYILGRTSSGNFPILSNAFQTNNAGSFDLFITKLSPNGNTVLASTYLGGNGADGVNISSNPFSVQSLKFNFGDSDRGDIFLDQNEQVYIISSTRSINFPVINAFQNNLNGLQDAIITKFSNNLSQLKFSTYLGGTTEEAGYSIKVSENKIYACGGTNSSDFPIISGAYQAVYNGNIDGFVVRVDTFTNSLDASTFIGTSAYDQTFFLDFSQSQSVLLLGQTSGNYPVTPGVYNNPNSGQFIQELSNDLTSAGFSTVFGRGDGNPDISPTAFLGDGCGNIYVSGWGSTIINNTNLTTNGLPLMNPTQSTTDGEDYYMIIFSQNASSLVYASFFGGNLSSEHVDGGTSRFDKKGVIYQAICGGCGANSDFPITPGASGNNSSNCNLLALKIDVDINIVAAEYSASPSFTGCAPYTLDFTNQSNSNNVIWNFAGLGSSTDTTPTFTFVNPGDYDVTLYAIDSMSCNFIDSIAYTVHVIAPPAISTTNQIICKGDSVQLNVSGGGVNYVWHPGTLLSDSTSSNPIAFVTEPTIFTVFAYNQQGCYDSSFVSIDFYTQSPISLTTDTTVCESDSFALFISGVSSVNWQASNLFLDPTALSQIISLQASTQLFLTYTDSATGCEYDTSIFITVRPLPTINLDESATICLGDSIQLSIPNSGSKLWTSNHGFSSTQSAPVVFPNQNTTFYIQLTDSLGCSNTDSISITVTEIPEAKILGDSIVCQNSRTILTAIGGDSYLWNTGQTTPNITVDALGDSIFWVIPTVNNCSGLPDTFLLKTTNDNPIADFSVNINSGCLPLEVNFSNQSINANSFVWQFGDGTSSTEISPTHTYTEDGFFDVKLIALKNGICSDTFLFKTIAVEGSQQQNVYVPNAFTPNGDGINDEFEVGSYIVPDSYELVVYNRWGQKVFESGSIENSWDGKFQGKDVPEGAYVYILKIKTCSSRDVKGVVTLIR